MFDTDSDKALRDFLTRPINGPILELAGERDDIIKAYLFPRLFTSLRVLYVDTARLLTRQDAAMITTRDVIYTNVYEHDDLINLLDAAKTINTAVIDNWYNVRHKPNKLNRFITELKRKAIKNEFGLIFINQLIMNMDYPEKSTIRYKPVYDRVFNEKCSLRLFIRQDDNMTVQAATIKNRGRFGYEKTFTRFF